MSDHTVCDRENLEFLDEQSVVYQVLFGFSTQLSRFWGVVPPSSIKLKGILQNLFAHPSFDMLSQLAGLAGPDSSRMFSFHNRRFRVWLILSYALAALLFFFLLLIVQFLFVYWNAVASDFFKGYRTFLGFVVLGIFVTVAYSVIVRVVSMILDKRFAESICIYTVLNLVLELSRPDILTRPDRKKILLYRIKYLARMTLLLAARFASDDDSNQTWVQKHFRKMTSYIQERERWAIAPTETTLADLRRDFCRLAPLYISGMYGSFSYQEEIDEQKESPPSWQQRLINGLPRFVGIILPLILMGLYLWIPDLFPRIELDSGVVTLVFLAWLLLSIDASLELGIVASLTDLAKGIKDLG